MIVKVCEHCDSSDVVCDAYAVWSIERQEWVVHSTYDSSYCNACGEPTTLIEKELSDV